MQIVLALLCNIWFNKTMKRTINKNKLRKLLHGRKEEIAYKAKVSASLLEKLVSNYYEIMPKEETRWKICKALRVDMEELFPMSEAA